MSYSLQNHPGNRKLPVRFSPVILQQKGRGLGSISIVYIFVLGILGSTVFLGFNDPNGFGGLLRNSQGDAIAALTSMTWEQLQHNLLLVVLPLIVILTVPILMFRQMQRPLKEQRAYYGWRQMNGPTDQHRRALRLAGGWNYVRKVWPLSLEYWPVKAGIPKRKQRSFKSFQFSNVEDERNQIAADWGILNEINLREVLESCLADGVDLQTFALDMEFGGIEFAERVAAIGNVNVSDVIECLTGNSGRPPALLWGLDLLRAHHIVRSGYMAGYLKADDAWDYLDRITDYTAALFPTEEQFLTNACLGYALWTGVEQRAKGLERQKLYAEYLKSEWTEYLGAWPQPEKHALPEVMTNGFAELRQTLRDKRDGNSL